MTLLKCGLHPWFNTYSRRGQRLKYDHRPLIANERQFTLVGEIRDIMSWTLASGVTIWMACEVLILRAMTNGRAPRLTSAANPVWFIALFFLILIRGSFYFHGIHRLRHMPLLCKQVHTLHRRHDPLRVRKDGGPRQKPL